MSLAVQAQDLLMTDHLLNLSCDVNALNPTNMLTPLHHAANACNIEAVIMLLEHGANVNDKNDAGKCASIFRLITSTLLNLFPHTTPFIYVCRDIDYGCQQQYKDETPMMLAVKKRSAPVVTKLIDAQCNPEIYDGDGASLVYKTGDVIASFPAPPRLPPRQGR